MQKLIVTLAVKKNVDFLRKIGKKLMKSYHNGVFGHIHAALFIDLCLYLVELPCNALICTYLSAVPFPASVGE
jgi:hypothetical protein